MAQCEKFFSSSLLIDLASLSRIKSPLNFSGQLDTTCAAFPPSPPHFPPLNLMIHARAPPNDKEQPLPPCLSERRGGTVSTSHPCFEVSKSCSNADNVDAIVLLHLDSAKLADVFFDNIPNLRAFCTFINAGPPCNDVTARRLDWLARL